MSSGRVRLDDLMVRRGLAADRDAALRAVIAGDVKVEGAKASSSAEMIDGDAVLSVVSPARFVSRGGAKLEGALEAFRYEPKGLSCLDCGTSTGGFTDCLLQHGASHVCAVDVGYGQFAWKLRVDERVLLFERTNIRDLPADLCGAPFDLAVADVSFAPLHTYLPTVVNLLKPDGAFITLVKPQFEAARSQVGEHGVVHDPEVHVAVIRKAVSNFASQGLVVQGLCFSPIKGPMGNIEYLLFGKKGAPMVDVDVETVVADAHTRLDGGPSERGMATEDR